MVEKGIDLIFAKTLLLSIVSLLVISHQTTATHIRAGNILIERTEDELTFRFHFVGFRDSGSSVPFGHGDFNLGDGTIRKEVINHVPIIITAVENELERVEFTIVHTYPGVGEYIVSYQESFRNLHVINMSNSGDTDFYVESMLDIDPIIGVNNYPVLTVPPIDFAAIGAFFIHNPGAFDQDGDSLSYEFVTPRKSRTEEVDNYRVLNNPAFYSDFATGSEGGAEPVLTLDARSGELVWDAPGDAELNGVREYNVALKVKEYREVLPGRWMLLSYIVRDMQIIVKKTNNKRPYLEVPPDVCVVAGSKINKSIIGQDPNINPVKLEAFGGPFEVPSSATYTPFPPEFQESPGSLSFTWNTVCGHVRERPYEVQFKVTDDPEKGPSLVNFETFRITVVGPAPTGLTTTVQPEKTIQLNWDEYSCSNADLMQVWRKVGTYNLEVDECQVGMPANTGYQLIDTVDITTTEYLDTNNGQGLAAGANYCYRLVAVFTQAGGDALSYVSEETCDSLIIDMPVITNVDIQSTGEADGEILVRWTPPYQIDENVYPPAYAYDLFRAEEITGGNYEMIAEGIYDTVFVDTGLNTRDRSYNYFVRFYDADGLLVDSSSTASSVRLELRPLLQSIEVNWSAVVPWSLQVKDYPYHYIYRDRVFADAPDQLVLIDSVDASMRGLSYLDNGEFNNEPLDEEIEYCYYVVTQGSYDNKLLPEPLINRSQISCAQPNDTIPPCSPSQLSINNTLDCEAIISTKSCESSLFSNALSWEVNTDPDCDEDVVGYNVYFSPSGSEEDYIWIASVNDSSFIHSDLDSFKGCYRVSSVDRSGNESELGEEVCNDNCPVYTFPNVFTPNQDGKNDVFTPLFGSDGSFCPRFVKSVVFRVYDRAGAEVFAYDSFENPNGILINWDGTTNQGRALPSSVYFYEAEVTFDVLRTEEAKKSMNGWIQLLK